MTKDELAIIARNSPATDLLETHMLFDEADVLRRAKAVAERLERAVKILEYLAADQIFCDLDSLDLIAGHRGETTDVSMNRLRPVSRLPIDAFVGPGTLPMRGPQANPRRSGRALFTEPPSSTSEPRMLEAIRRLAPDAVEVVYSPAYPVGTILVRMRDGSTRMIGLDEMLEIRRL